MRPLVIYHAQCVDGAGAAFAAWCKFGEDAEYRPALYGDPEPTDDEVRDRYVYVLDFSYKPEVVKRIAKSAKHVTVVDHHVSFFEAFRSWFASQAEPDPKFGGFYYMNANISLLYDATKSGAVLAWNYFHGDSMVEPRGRRPVPELLLYIQDKDLWKWELPNSKEISAALEAHGVRTDFRVLALLSSRVDKDGVMPFSLINELAVEGKSILRANAQFVDSMVANRETVVFRFLRSTLTEMGLLGAVTLWNDDGVWGAVHCYATNTPILQSEVGAKLAELAIPNPAPDANVASRAPMGIAWFYDGSRGTYRVSLRSVGDFDVSGIAKNYGGGGHKNSAGFECEQLPWSCA